MEAAGLSPQIPESIRSVISAFRSRLEVWYGERLDRIILYGSYARGDYHEDSDIDLLIILNDEKILRLQEINDLVALKYDLMLHNKTLISTKAVTKTDYQNRPNAIFQFIKREGVLV